MNETKLNPQRPKDPNEQRRGHKLLTEEIRKQLPPLYSQDGKGGKAIAHCKFFTPDSNFTWFVTEFDGEDLFFGHRDRTRKRTGVLQLNGTRIHGWSPEDAD